MTSSNAASSATTVSDMDSAMVEAVNSPALPFEILALIFEQVLLEAETEVDHNILVFANDKVVKKAKKDRMRRIYETRTWLQQIRLLSPGLAEILQPMLFKYVNLTRPDTLCHLIKEAPADKHWPRFEENIIKHVKLLRVASTAMKSKYFNAPGVLRLLSDSTSLRGLMYMQYLQRHGHNIVLVANKRSWEIGRCRHFTNVGPAGSNLMNAFFANQHVFIINIDNFSVRLSRSNLLQTIHYQKQTKRNLSGNPPRTLRIAASQDGCHFFNSDKFTFRFPAVQNVELDNYDWNHSTEEYLLRFDFSGLRDLSIHDVDLFKFLSSVPVQHLENLKTLEIHNTYGYLDSRFDLGLDEEPIAPFFEDLFPRLTRLTKLDIQLCNRQMYIYPELIFQASALRILRLKTDARTPHDAEPVTMEELEDIRLGCPDLSILELMWPADQKTYPYEAFINALAGFGNIEILRIWTWFSIEPAADDTSTDPEYDTAMMVFDRLIEEKQGKPFKSIQIGVHNIEEKQVPANIEARYDPTIFAVTIEDEIVVESGDKRLDIPPADEDDYDEDDYYTKDTKMMEYLDRLREQDQSDEE